MSKRRLAIFIGPVVLLIAAGSIFVGWQRLASTKVTATLYKGKGEVLYKLPNKPYVLLEDDKVELENLSSVKTSSGTATVVFPDGSMISISEKTEIQIKVENNVTTILQYVGNTYHRIKKLIGVNEYQVQSPTAIAAVRGTKFGVTVEKETTVVFVTESEVEVKNKVTKSLVVPGKEAIVAGDDEPIPVSEMPTEFQQTQWFQENIQIDKEFDKEIKNQTSKQAKVQKVIDSIPAAAQRVKSSTKVTIIDSLMPSPTSEPTLIVDPKIKVKDVLKNNGNNVLGITSPSLTPTSVPNSRLNNGINNRVNSLQTAASPTPTTVPAGVVNKLNSTVNRVVDIVLPSPTTAPTAVPSPTTPARQSVGGTVNNVVDGVNSTLNNVVVIPTVPLKLKLR